jgi:hypothetical protein
MCATGAFHGFCASIVCATSGSGSGLSASSAALLYFRPYFPLPGMTNFVVCTTFGSGCGSSSSGSSGSSGSGSGSSASSTALLCSRKMERGYITYGVERKEDFVSQQSVVVGKDDSEYYVLIVRQRGEREGEYERVGIGKI